MNREAIRTFSLSRLADPKLTDKRFTVPKDFNPDEYLRGNFSVFKGKDDHEVVIDFDVWATDLVRGRQWHSSQEFTELPVDFGLGARGERVLSARETLRFGESRGVICHYQDPLTNRPLDAVPVLSARGNTSFGLRNVLLRHGTPVCLF